MSEFNSGDQAAVNRSGEAAVESVRQGAGEASRLNFLDLLKSNGTTGGGPADGSSGSGASDAKQNGQGAGDGATSLDFPDIYRQDDVNKKPSDAQKLPFNPDDLKKHDGDLKDHIQDPPFNEEDLKNKFDPKDIPGYEDDAKRNGELFRRAQQEAEIKRMLQNPGGKDFDYPGREEDARRNGEQWQIRRMLRQLQRDKVDFQ